MKPGDIVSVYLRNKTGRDLLMSGLYITVEDGMYVLLEVGKSLPWVTDNRKCYIQVNMVGVTYDIEVIA